MMHFNQPAIDGPLLAELREAGVLAPDVVEKIDAHMGHPETGTLNGFLLAGADFVPENAWLIWLIRRHGCHRFGRVEWHDEVSEHAKHARSCDGNLPFRRCADGALLVSVLRPDLFAQTAQQLAPTRLHRAAATLRELRALHARWPQPN